MTLTLFLSLIVLAIIFFVVSMIPDPRWPYLKYSLRVGGCIFVILATFIGYMTFRNVKAPSELEKHLSIYPNSISTGFIPKVSDDRYWIFETTDEPKKAAEFYEQETSRTC